MITSNGKSLQGFVHDFFTQHLAVERNASPKTIQAYRDAMKLFITYAANLKKCSPDQLDFAVLDVKIISSFLEWLQRERGCGARTRNHRLAVIKSFVRYIAFTAPEHLEQCRLIRALLPARFKYPAVQYLDEDEVVKVIASIDASTPKGRRDRTIMLLLYNTGARVQELLDLNVGDIREQPIILARLQCKGRKQRNCPVWSRTFRSIQQMLGDRDSLDDSQPLFLNARGQRLSRSGVAYLLRCMQKYCALQPRHAEHFSPHVMRHTTAMHLLQSGVDITTIAAWLGHAQLTTTHGYVDIDLRMKQAALAGDVAVPLIRNTKYPSPGIINWLEKLARRPAGYVESSEQKGLPSSKMQGGRTRLRITNRSG